LMLTIQEFFPHLLPFGHELHLFEDRKFVPRSDFFRFQTLEMRHFFLSSYLFDGFPQRPENSHDCSPKPAVSYGEKMILMLHIDLELQNVV
ncbi:hypothetical protein ACXWP3_09285, partial [Streptococcus pyogenes]